MTGTGMWTTNSPLGCIGAYRVWGFWQVDPKPIPTEQPSLGPSTQALSPTPLSPKNGTELCACLLRISMWLNRWTHSALAWRRILWTRSLHRIFVRRCEGHYRPWTPVRDDALVGIGFRIEDFRAKTSVSIPRLCVLGDVRIVSPPYCMWAEAQLKGFWQGGIHVPT